jgi:BirA family transcriptional regulator, biotin operon repressor / biotin---[acetyl-CoA-carboxylase] ligase
VSGPTELRSVLPARTSSFERWTLHEYAVCASTNLVAASLPAWQAVRAETQTRGRGRFERSWVSDSGGLWLSAVVPVTPKSPAWRFLPVAVGYSICQTVAALGGKGLRLRWPNDVLVGERKLAGLLLDQFSAGLVVVGIGINVTNTPESCDASLAGQTIRLADLICPVPNLSALAAQVLDGVGSVVDLLESRGPEFMLKALQGLWQAPRPVRLDLDGQEVRGNFVGVDATGRLELHCSNSPPQFFDPQQVRCLREIQPSHS